VNLYRHHLSILVVAGCLHVELLMRMHCVFFTSRRRHTRSKRDLSSDVCSSDLALFRLAFATAPHSLLNLASNRNSPVHSTKGTPSPINGLWLLVSTRFQVLFHSPSGVLFTFPSRYWFTIGH